MFFLLSAIFEVILKVNNYLYLESNATLQGKKLLGITVSLLVEL